MRAPLISEDFVPVSEFKAQAAEWLRRIGETDAPLVVTQHGKPAGVLLSPRALRSRPGLRRGGVPPYRVSTPSAAVTFSVCVLRASPYVTVNR